ncbi:hypothetical protein VSR01_18305 [Actinacidiphila sp. DG2A-62]|uniref:hypothetical protein n=1 Tax=Actinacidiphila sp. DG2A-62 TaxID=3108821 RepID=UPI002DBD8A62|nr:hypothetical protein [Actinacidiphila sp. DG2A-62]MEC3995381.1 hypothetical protein [Actinacidiphila sp. DG2A-62]
MAATAALLVCGTAAVLALWPRGADAPAAAPVGTAHLATVARDDLSTSVSVDGTLGYGTPRTLHGGATGRVTWVPVQGATITRGHQLYRIDDRPTVLFYGSTPLYRPLDRVGTVGPDVRVVADNLKALGYDIGAQPAVGSYVTPAPPPTSAAATGSAESAAPGAASADAAARDSASAAPQKVRRGDAVLTTSLRAAISRWQHAQQLPATGVLDIPDIVVSTGAVRVAELKAQVGDDGAADLMTVTGTGKVVTVALSADQFTSLHRGDHVKVTLPDGTTAPGRVVSVGTAVTDSDTGGAEDTAPTRTVIVTLDRTDAADGVDTAPVHVLFTGTTKKDVLVVPVGALVALSGGGYAVQRPDGSFVRVATGLFAQGLVEITGPVAAGQRVVTSS